MTPALHRFGDSASPVVVVDDVTGAVDQVKELAAAMAPFPSAVGTYYPGLRQPIRAGDAAYAYVEQLLEMAAPFVGGGFDVDRFDLIDASFSMITADPASLDPAQRAPHFDSTDPGHMAILHYLSDTAGTAFYRQRATGIEIVDNGNVAAFVTRAKRVADGLSGYVHGTTPDYEQIGMVEGRRDRLVIYRGAMLHTGIVSPGMSFSNDPRVGRLTTNIFIQCHRNM
jgi:hypothetical protein